jgi:hypothetical protein
MGTASRSRYDEGWTSQVRYYIVNETLPRELKAPRPNINRVEKAYKSISLLIDKN